VVGATAQGAGSGSRRGRGGRGGGKRRRGTPPRVGRAGRAPPRAGAHAQGREGGRAQGREGEGEGERGEGKGRGKTHHRGSNSGDHRLQNLGHHGEREVGERGCCTGNPNERGRGGGGAWGGGQGRQGRAGRAGPGRAGLGWAGPLRGSKPTTRTTLKGNQSPTEIRNGTRRTRDIRQRNALRHDATPMTLRFWFIHDTNTCHYTGLKLGRKSETGREKRVTPEFGERKEEKNSTLQI
jgi:hypothetical protein